MNVEQGFSYLSKHRITGRIDENMHWGTPSPESPKQSGMGWAVLRTCISNKLPGDAVAPGPGGTFRDPLTSVRSEGAEIPCGT